MMLRAALIVALLAVAVYGGWEMRRWKTMPDANFISPKQYRLRIYGLFFIVLSLGLWLGGTYLPNPPRHPKSRNDREIALRYIGYWTLTVLAAVPLVPLALLDSRENLLRLAEERRKLLYETLSAEPDDQ